MTFKLKAGDCLLIASCYHLPLNYIIININNNILSEYQYHKCWELYYQLLIISFVSVDSSCTCRLGRGWPWPGVVLSYCGVKCQPGVSVPVRVLSSVKQVGAARSRVNGVKPRANKLRSEASAT